MAGQLWPLRHGEAVPHDDDDDARPLTDRGREQSRAAGGALAALEVVVHDCYTSPKVRARETAELACEALGIQPVEHPPLRLGFDARDALELLGGDRRGGVLGPRPALSRRGPPPTRGGGAAPKGG